MKMSLLEDLEDEVSELNINEVVYDFQNYGVITAVKYGLCRAIKTAYSQFGVGFIDYYNNSSLSLKTVIVDLNSYSVIVDSNELSMILEEYYFNTEPTTNYEVGSALLDVINKLFVKCRNYAEEQVDYYYNF